jgi:4-hydroxy-tetrahydrodipicolinate reductase
MKVALVGLGRTGQTIAEYLLKENVLNMVLCRKDSEHAGLELSQVLNCNTTEIKVETTEHLNLKLLKNHPDVIIDFSGPEFLRENIHILEKHGIHVVTAVTEYTSADIEKFKTIGQNKRIGIILVPNITYGVNVMMLMAQMAAQLMKDYDFEIIEAHHNRKKDVPSGTAKKLAYKIDEILQNFSEEREKITPVHSIRSGGIVGKHRVVVVGKYDKIEIIHESFSRVAFAEGALKAANFIVNRVGYYEMEDVFAEEQKVILATENENPTSEDIIIC